MNGFSIEKYYNLLKDAEVTEASETDLFNGVVPIKSIEEIELGTDGTTESIVRLNDGGFIVFNRTVESVEMNTIRSD